MNTKTMRLPPRRVFMPNNKKRKERDDFDLKHLTAPPTKSPKPAVPSAGADKATHPVHSNHLLAGYLAHEFLTRGTLFGQPWDPARPQQTAAEAKREIKEEVEPSERSSDAEPKPNRKPDEKHQRYVEVASLLKGDGAHIPGIVNPNQLARFLRI